MVTAELPPFGRTGSRIDVSVSALGDATNLTGGTLLVTPLLAADGEVYAVAQGALATGAIAAGGAAASVTRGVPTAGRIPNGATVDLVKLLWGFDIGKGERLAWAQAACAPSSLLTAQRALLQELADRTLRKRGNPLDVIRGHIRDYSSLDPFASLALARFYRERLAQERLSERPVVTTWDVANRTDVYNRVLWNMERLGITFDRSAALRMADGDPDGPNEQLGGLRAKMQAIEKKLGEVLQAATGRLGVPNLSSTPQLREIFYRHDGEQWLDLFGMEAVHLTPKGVPSTKAEVLEDWADRGMQEARLLLDYREIQKIIGTYLDALPKFLTPDSVVPGQFRIHGQFRRTGAVTGRLSAANPNLTNIPAHGDLADLIRAMFIAGVWGTVDPRLLLDELADVRRPDLPPDVPMTMIVADYSQVELAIMAHFSGDPNMVEAIRQKKDLHCLTVELATGGKYTYAEMKAAKDAAEAGTATPEQLHLVEVRSDFKKTGFGIIYGIGAVKLGAQTGKQIQRRRLPNGRWHESCPEGEELIESYFRAFPTIKQFIQDTHASCRRLGYVQTITGRKRRLSDINSPSKGLRGRAERQAVNAIIQGTAADIAITAMVKIARNRRLAELGCSMLLQVHDEIVLTCPDIPEVIEECKLLVKECMENPFAMKVPIRCSPRHGASWSEAKG
jgi:DNA polymerase-1